MINVIKVLLEGSVFVASNKDSQTLYNNNFNESSNNQKVRIIDNDIPIFKEKDFNSNIIKKLSNGTILEIGNIIVNNGTNWVEVLYNNEIIGYIARDKKELLNTMVVLLQDNTNIYREPSKESEEIHRYIFGTQVFLIEYITINNNTWTKIKDSSGEIGYIEGKPKINDCIYEALEENKRKKISKYLFFLFIGLGNLIIINGYLSNISDEIHYKLNILTYLIVYIIQLIFIYKIWNSIQDGYARTSPAKAIIGLFIPIYQFYWIFQVYWGFSIDFNNFIKRHSLTISNLTESLFLTLTILLIITPILSAIFASNNSISMILIVLNTVIELILINLICNGINSLPIKYIIGLEKDKLLNLEKI